MLRAIPFTSCVFGLLILLCLGCTAPALTSRVIEQDSTWFVRLDSLQDTGSDIPRYDHPTAWRQEDLSAILSRLFIQERVGLMDHARPPSSVFSSEELNLLVPAIRTSFQTAAPSQWVSFVSDQSLDGGRVITSGAMFMEAGKLHVVIANHRLPLAGNAKELARVQANPLYSVHGSGGTLGFDSPQFVMHTKSNWTGGHRASASELILDHAAFLSYLQRTGAAMVPSHGAQSKVSASEPEFHVPRPQSSNPGQTDVEGTILRLRKEIEILKQQLAEKEGEIDRLKRRNTPTTSPQ